MPGITHWQSPNFFAFFPANNSGPSILGDLLSSGLGVQGMLWATSPACTELETHVLDWLVGMMGLPGRFLSSSPGGGVIQHTASDATLCALLAARERRSGFATNARGVTGRMTAYTSTQAHSSVEKAMTVAGLGRENLRTDRRGRAVRHATRSAGAGDRRGSPGGRPAVLGGGDCRDYFLRRRRPAARRLARSVAGTDCGCMWMRPSYGTAALCPEFRHMFQGLELADSYCFNPHKWMFVNFDCDCFFVADRAALIRTLSVLPEYLKNKATESGAVIDYRDWHVPLGRRFRALKLWFVIRHYGVEGLRAKVREHVALAQQFAQLGGRTSRRSNAWRPRR